MEKQKRKRAIMLLIVFTSPFYAHGFEDYQGGEETKKLCTDSDGKEFSHGTSFTPNYEEPCQQCICDNGYTTLCSTAACSPPPHCLERKAIPRECCKFDCEGNNSRPPFILHNTTLNDIATAEEDNITNLSLRLVASTVTSFLVLALLLFMVHRLRQRRLMMAMRRFEAQARQQRGEEDEGDHYIPAAFLHIQCPPYEDPPPPYSPPKPPHILPADSPPPYEEVDTTQPTSDLDANANVNNNNNNNDQSYHHHHHHRGGSGEGQQPSANHSARLVEGSSNQSARLMEASSNHSARLVDVSSNQNAGLMEAAVEALNSGSEGSSLDSCSQGTSGGKSSVASWQQGGRGGAEEQTEMTLISRRQSHPYDNRSSHGLFLQDHCLITTSSTTTTTTTTTNNPPAASSRNVVRNEQGGARDPPTTSMEPSTADGRHRHGGGGGGGGGGRGGKRGGGGGGGRVPRKTGRSCSFSFTRGPEEDESLRGIIALGPMSHSYHANTNNNNNNATTNTTTTIDSGVQTHGSYMASLSRHRGGGGAAVASDRKRSAGGEGGGGEKRMVTKPLVKCDAAVQHSHRLLQEELRRNLPRTVASENSSSGPSSSLPLHHHPISSSPSSSLPLHPPISSSPSSSLPVHHPTISSSSCGGAQPIHREPSIFSSGGTVARSNSASAARGNSASVPRGNSASVPHGNLASVPHSNSASVPHGNSASVPHGNLASVPHGNLASVPRCNSASVPHGNSASVPHSNSASVPRCNSASVAHGNSASAADSNSAPTQADGREGLDSRYSGREGVGGGAHRGGNSAPPAGCESMDPEVGIVPGSWGGGEVVGVGGRGSCRGPPPLPPAPSLPRSQSVTSTFSVCSETGEVHVKKGAGVGEGCVLHSDCQYPNQSPLSLHHPHHPHDPLHPAADHPHPASLSNYTFPSYASSLPPPPSLQCGGGGGPNVPGLSKTKSTNPNPNPNPTPNPSSSSSSQQSRRPVPSPPSQELRPAALPSVHRSQPAKAKHSKKTHFAPLEKSKPFSKARRDKGKGGGKKGEGDSSHRRHDLSGRATSTTAGCGPAVQGVGGGVMSQGRDEFSPPPPPPPPPPSSSAARSHHQPKLGVGDVIRARMPANAPSSSSSSSVKQYGFVDLCPVSPELLQESYNSNSSNTTTMADGASRNVGEVGREWRGGGGGDGVGEGVARPVPPPSSSSTLHHSKGQVHSSLAAPSHHPSARHAAHGGEKPHPHPHPSTLRPKNKARPLSSGLVVEPGREPCDPATLGRRRVKALHMMKKSRQSYPTPDNFMGGAVSGGERKGVCVDLGLVEPSLQGGRTLCGGGGGGGEAAPFTLPPKRPALDRGWDKLGGEPSAELLEGRMSSYV